jgi:hypothetical protein
MPRKRTPNDTIAAVREKALALLAHFEKEARYLRGTDPDHWRFAQLTGKAAGYEDAAYRLREFIAEALPLKGATDGNAD